MREQRRRDSSNGSPSWRRSHQRDPGIRENRGVSPYISPTPTWSELNCSRMVPSREVPISGGDVRSFYACESKNPERGEYGKNRRSSDLNRIDDPVHPQRSLFGMAGSIPRGEEYNGEGRKLSMPGFRGKSTSGKFQWDTIFAADNNPAYVNSTRTSYGGSYDSGAVPVSMPIDKNGRGSSIGCYNQRMEAYENGRNYGFIDGRYAPQRQRSSIVDSIVDKVERHKNIDTEIDNENDFRFNMMSKKRRMLLDSDTLFSENGKDVNGRSFNVNPAENKYLMEDFGVQRNDNKLSVYRDVERIPMLCEEYDSGNSWEQAIPLEEALQLRLEQKRLDNEKLLELRLKRNRIDNQIISLSYGGNAGSDTTSNGHIDWNAEEQLEMFEDSTEAMFEHSREAMFDDLGEAVFKDSREAMYQVTSTGSAFDDGNSFSSADGLSMPRRSSKPHKPSKKDLRQRLGPVKSVKQRLEFPQQVGKRLITLQSKKKYPWIRHVQENTLEDHERNMSTSVREVKYEDNRRKKFAKTEQKNSAKIELEEYAKTEPEEYTKLEQKEYAKTEPSEDSEEFKNQVQKSFLKLFKILNENSADLRIYLEQGGAGRLKCCICGSSSKEFVGALGLAQHAFLSCKSRSEHLGLHKAICVLMGWNSSLFVKGRWIQQILPPAEASSLREDLIIWPPVVLIHNSSLSNDNKDKHMTVSIEGLKRILRGMGCDLKMANVFHGKAAYQNSMVVSFSGTYSGFHEAEKLHKLFSKKRRGRAEFQKLLLNGHETNHKETQNIVVDDKTNNQDTQNALASDITNHQEAQNALVDEKMDSQDTESAMVCDKENPQEAQNVQIEEKMDPQDTESAMVCDKENPQEAQNVQIEEKMDPEDTVNTMVGDKANHQEARNVHIEKKMDSQDIENTVNHQETQNVLVYSKTNFQDAQNVLAGDKMNHQDESQNILVDDKTNHEENQNILSEDKLNHQDTQNILAKDKLDHQEETRYILVDDNSHHEETRNVLAENITNNGEVTQNFLVDDKTNPVLVDDKTYRQDTPIIQPGDKMNHQEAQNALVDERMDTQDMVGDKTNHQETQYVVVDEKMDTRGIGDAMVGDETNHEDAQNILEGDKTNHQNVLVDANKPNHKETQNVFLHKTTNLEKAQKILSDTKSKCQETPNVLVDDVENFLYGYMGMASDLGALDSNTKKRSVVRSKREMEAAANASIKTESVHFIGVG